MRRFVVVTCVAIAGVSAVPAAASAGQPATHACTGASVSALATNQAAPGGFGAAVVGFAQDPDGRPGLGDGIQAFQAGDVPDDVVPNTCND